MPLYAATIFLSAFLLFLVQPILAKQVLPWYGGTAVVWTTCMVFFQFALLVGYAYSHWLTRWPSPRRVALVHVTLLVASLAVLPIIPNEVWKPTGSDNPVWGILLLLGATIGLPYFLLSTTSPLVQAWFARAHPGRSPYRLFALSNFASMLALLGYPFLFEPWLASPEQSVYWSFGYGAFVLLCGALAWNSRALEPLPAIPPTGNAQQETPAPTLGDLTLWLALAALGSVALLAVSNHLTQNVSSVPLLWVAPLAIYLLTFILCFEGTRWYRRDAYLGFLVWIVCVMAWFLADRRLQFELLWQMAVFGAGLYGVCMFCHGELARLRPGPRHLTLFYLVVSLGGVVGGVLVGIVAPLTLPGYLELEIALVLVALLALYLNLDRPKPIIAMFAAVSLFATGALAYRFSGLKEGTLLIERNFYGVVRVKEGQSDPADPDSRYRTLVHGAILHGEQYLGDKYRRSATSYYKTTSGIGKALLALHGQDIRVGVIGLGTGTLAAYGDEGDVYRFYDINPAVARIAQEQFTYLSDTRAKTEIVLGDARLNLEREPPQNYDVLAVDAFSGDSIPVHLITDEAIGAYLRHMKPEGVIAFHTSNRFLDLKPVLLAIAEKRGLAFAYVNETAEDGGTSSDWVLISRDKRLLLTPEIASATEPVLPRPTWRLWTDTYNNLLQVWR